MDNDTYSKFFAVFEAVAKPILEEARKQVQREYGILCESVEVIDHDVERGLGFIAKSTTEANTDLVFVELMLTDGDERGYYAGADVPTVGLMMTVTEADGTELAQIAPYNFTKQVGTSDPAELARRLTDYFNSDDIASIVNDAWGSAYLTEKHPDNHQSPMVKDQARFEMMHAIYCSDEGAQAQIYGGLKGTRGNAVYFNPDNNTLSVVLGHEAMDFLAHSTKLIGGRTEFEFDNVEKEFWRGVLSSVDLMEGGNFELAELSECGKLMPNMPREAWDPSDGAFTDELVLVFDATFDEGEGALASYGAAWKANQGKPKSTYEKFFNPDVGGIAHLQCYDLTAVAKDRLVQRLPAPQWDWAQVVHPDVRVEREAAKGRTNDASPSTPTP